MKFSWLVIAVLLSGTFLTAPAFSHDLVDANGKPMGTHQHVWRQQSYGQDYRQGHSVNNALGNIVIWSPNTFQGYRAGSNIRFARPSPNLSTKAGASVPQFNTPPRSTYGKSPGRD